MSDRVDLPSNRRPQALFDFDASAKTRFTAALGWPDRASMRRGDDPVEVFLSCSRTTDIEALGRDRGDPRESPAPARLRLRDDAQRRDARARSHQDLRAGRTRRTREPRRPGCWTRSRPSPAKRRRSSRSKEAGCDDRSSQGAQCHAQPRRWLVGVVDVAHCEALQPSDVLCGSKVKGSCKTWPRCASRNQSRTVVFDRCRSRMPGTEPTRGRDGTRQMLLVRLA